MTEQEMKQQFARHLYQKMGEQGWTQQQLADCLYRFYGYTVQRSTVSGWLHAKQMPRPIVMQWIAECFGESIGDFIQFEKENDV